MSSADLLARLNPKITSYGARGGIPELTPLDIAAGLAGAPQNAQRTALAAFAGFPDPCLPGLIEARLVRLAKHEGWRGWEGTDRLRQIARIAVSEYCEPPRCLACEGRAIVYAPLPGNCLACNGSGYGRLRATQMCDAIGVSLSEWKAAWRYRYDRAYAIVAGWGSEALSHLARRLSTDDEMM
ncbi:MAG: hypothetical protein ACREXU_14950 [Gammaproteobacteria bacterium]